MIYIISGFPRTGTSMMMTILDAGGMDVAYSEEREDLKDIGDEFYSPNEKFYEIKLSEYNEFKFPLKYEEKCVKVMSWGLHKLYPHSYRIILMLRDPEEIRQSYEAAFGKIDVSNYWEKMEELQLRMLNRKDVISLDTLDYRTVVENPEVLFTLDWPFDVKKGKEKVKKEMCRFRIENLEVGI